MCRSTPDSEPETDPHGGPPVTVWIEQVQNGDAAAAQHLWELYFSRMVGLASQRLHGAKRAVADEEDVAISAFRSFCDGARQGRFDQLADRDNLWPLLVSITLHKSIDHIRKQNRQKRGGGFEQSTDPAHLSSTEPDPQLAASISEQFNLLMQKLAEAEDPELEEIAVRKMEGEQNPEISAALGCSRRTIERKLVLIRKLWESTAAEGSRS